VHCCIRNTRNRDFEVSRPRALEHHLSSVGVHRRQNVAHSVDSREDAQTLEVRLRNDVAPTRIAHEASREPTRVSLEDSEGACRAVARHAKNRRGLKDAARVGRVHLHSHTHKRTRARTHTHTHTHTHPHTPTHTHTHTYTHTHTHTHTHTNTHTHTHTSNSLPALAPLQTHSLGFLSPSVDGLSCILPRRSLSASLHGLPCGGYLVVVSCDLVGL
jgi:hypothetical protein